MQKGNRTTIRYACEHEKVALTSNFKRRKWLRSENADDWNFLWCGKSMVRQIFNGDNGYRLSDDQLINHFPNHWELTRKDNLIKNIKRYRRELDKLGNPIAEKDPVSGKYKYLDFVPTTFVLPADYSLFLEDYKKESDSMWIIKPSGRCQGRDIVIVNKLSQIKKWAMSKFTPSSVTANEAYVISKYVDAPLLLGGKKFDLRLYVLVTSYRPLKVYSYNDGFARFCNVKYSHDIDEMDNQFMHLTNVAIQKGGEEYNSLHGNKWSLENLRLYLSAIYGATRTAKLFHDIMFVYIHTLKSVQNTMINDKHCFECYGFDLLIDTDLKPWLIEVNACPSLSASTPADGTLKHQLIDDLLDVVIPPSWGGSNATESSSSSSSPSPRTAGTRQTAGWNSALQVGKFRLIYDESQIVDTETEGRQVFGYENALDPTAGDASFSAAAAASALKLTASALNRNERAEAANNANSNSRLDKWR